MLIVSCSLVLAQQHSVSGTVTGPDGNPMPGITVQVQGTNTGTATDANGHYQLSVPDNATLIFRGVGFAQQEVEVNGRSNVDISMEASTKRLDELVVTALGIQRSKNELPYAAQEVTSDEITNTRGDNFINSLQGQVAGLRIKTSNDMGGSTDVILRGYKTISHSNQALFVIDGVPISNSNTNTSDEVQGFAGDVTDSYDYGNAAADINPDDIASITVLKGAAASALYGSRAANGVILITTKKGKKGLGVTLNIGASTGWMDKSTWMHYQHEYGSGYYDPAFYTYSDVPPSPDSHFWYFDANGDGTSDLVVPTSEDASFGAKFNSDLKVYTWESFDPSSPKYMKPQPWVAAKHDPTYFFEQPVNTSASLFVRGGDEKFTYKLGYTRNGNKGILPNSKLTKDMVNFRATYNLTSRLTADASINFSKISGLGRYEQGYGGSQVTGSFRQWYEMNVDMKAQKEAYFRTGQNISWNITDPSVSLDPIFWNNPYFVRYKSYENDHRNRYIGYVGLNYQVTDWLDLRGRVSLDSYNEMQEERNAVGSVDPAAYRRFNRSYREYNYNFIARFDKDLSEDFNLKALLGANLRRDYISSIDAHTNGGLVVPGLYALSNSLNPITAPDETDLQSEVGGVFAGATLSYKKMLTLDVTARQDQSSTLPTGNNTYFYPSISGSFVFSELLKNVPWITFGKLRLNYAQVGTDASIAVLKDYYFKPDPFGSTPLFSVDETKNNSELKPELTRSEEAGVEMSFFNDRVGFDVTYYKTNTRNQVLRIQTSASIGYTHKYVNAGEIENKGWEVQFHVSPVRTNSFTWRLSANWSKNKNTVISLFDSTKNVLLGGFQGGVSLNATVGQPFGVLKGSDFVSYYAKNDDGKVVSDPANGKRIIRQTGAYAGNYAISPTTDSIIGNINPDWIGGIQNTFTYKGISLNFLITLRQGSDIYSIDRWYGVGTGLTENTVGLNDRGKPKRAPVSEGGGIKQEGVTPDGKPNEVYLESTGLRGPGYNASPNAQFIYDGSYVKLSEANLTYSLPAGLMKRLHPIEGIDISLYGRNLWIIHKNLPDADPEPIVSSGNVQGFQQGVYPTYRMFGFNLKFTF